MTTSARFIDISTDNIIPPHEVLDHNKHDRIASDMADSGFRGRPILVIGTRTDGHYQAITGSHRLAAAEASGVDTIPALVVYCDNDDDRGDLFDVFSYGDDDDGTLALLIENNAPQEAVDLMAQEIQS